MPLHNSKKKKLISEALRSSELDEMRGEIRKKKEKQNEQTKLWKLRAKAGLNVPKKNFKNFRKATLDDFLRSGRSQRNPSQRDK